MARRFGTSIDLLGFALLNAYLHPVSADPTGLGAGDAGRVWFNTTSGKFMVWNGTAAIDFLARANHTGTQTASTISDFTTAVQALRWSSMLAPNSPVDMGGQRAINQADPTAGTDSATKQYVDNALSSLSSGQTLKGAVRVAPITNVSLSAPGATIDGVAMTAGDVVLLTGQTTATQNGPYVWTGAAAALTRALNWDTSAEAVQGSFWIVEQGTNADTFALLTNDTAITLGTTALTFTFRGAAGATYTAGNGLQLIGTVFSILLAASSGLAVSGSGLSVDTSIVGRKVTGVIPAASSGIFTVSGATVTINHGLANYAPRLTLRAYNAPASGYSAGQLVEVDEVASDANNLVVTLPGAPAANNWYVSLVG